MKEVFYGVPLEQIGPAYFNIPPPTTQGTNQAGTSQQGGRGAEDVDPQVGQGSAAQGANAHSAASAQTQQSAGQNQMANFSTTDFIPPSATKIAPSQQRICRNTDSSAFNQMMQGGAQSGNQNMNIPLGFHYTSDYSTFNMIPNPGYQGTQNFNPQAAQQPRNPTDDLLRRMTEMMQYQFGLKPKGQTLSYKRPYPEWYDLVALPHNYRVPEFTKFTGQDGTGTMEHIT
jgi:hypothetical protein